MRKVPELRFAGFDGEWDMGTLSDLGSVSMNRRIYKEETSEIGDVPFYKIGTFGARADSYISRDLFEEYKSKYPYPKVGDLLISASGSIGKVIEYKGEDAYYQDSNIVWLDINEKVKNSFLKQFYETVNWNELEGSTIKRLYNKDLLRKKISYPKLSEQEKIGELFRKIDGIIEIQEGKVAKMEDFKKSMLQKMFPKKGELVPEFRFDGFDGEWRKLKLSHIGEIESSGVDKVIYEDQEIVSLLNYMDVYNNKAPNIGNKYTFMKTSASPKEILNKNIKKGDIFFTPTSETSEDIGHSMVISNDLERFVYSYHIFRFRPESYVLDINFSNYFANIEPVRKQLKIKAQGAQRYTLKLDDFRELIVKIPSLEEQAKIGQFFKNLDAQIDTEKKLLDSYKMMKKSLLQKMFV